jgi:hypothetical protein
MNKHAYLVSNLDYRALSEPFAVKSGANAFGMRPLTFLPIFFSP